MDPGIRGRDMFGYHQAPIAVVGFDVVGIVLSNGPNANLSIGAHVCSQASLVKPALGGLQEHTVIDSKYAITVPSNISDADASTFPINVFTTGACLFHPTILNIPLPGSEESKNFDYKSKTIVIIGAGTNNGQLAIQFSRIAGIGKIIAVASLASAEKLKRYGATDVVDRTVEDINAEVRKIVKDEDILYVFDGFNGDQDTGISMLSNSRKGTLAYLMPHAPPPNEELVKTKKAGYEAKTVFGAPSRYPDLAEPFYKAFVEWVESGTFQMLEYQVVEGLDPERVNATLDEIATRKSSVKFAVKVC